MTHSKHWVPLKLFIGVVSWLVDGKTSDIDWSGKFPSEMVYKIAQDFNIFVGIRGGELALRSMPIIKRKEWSITTVNEGKNSQWIDGKLYCQIIDEVAEI